MDLIGLSNAAATLAAGVLHAIAGGDRDQDQDDPLGRLYRLVESQLRTTASGARALDDLTLDPGNQQALTDIASHLHALARQFPRFADALAQAVDDSSRSGPTHASLNIRGMVQGGIAGRDNINKRTKIGTGGIVAIVLAGVALVCLTGGAGAVAIVLAKARSGFSVGDCVWQEESSRSLVKADCADPRSSTITRVVRGGQNPFAYCGGSEGWYVDEDSDVLYCYRSNAR